MSGYRFNPTMIDSMADLDCTSLTFEDLRVHYGTGRLIVMGSDRYDKKYIYRNGVATNVGDIETSLWDSLVIQLIEKNGEQELHRNLLEWYKDTCLWLKTKDKLRYYVLSLYVMRIFDDPEWCDYVPFNRKYRPEILELRNL